MESVGVENIRREAWRVSGYFIDALGELGVELAPCALSDRTRSDIVSFRTADTEQTYRYLRENRVACSYRCGYVRTGIHGYNTTDEVDQVIALLKRDPHLR